MIVAYTCASGLSPGNWILKISLLIKMLAHEPQTFSIHLFVAFVGAHGFY
jgi:hypothetical protein